VFYLISVLSISSSCTTTGCSRQSHNCWGSIYYSHHPKCQLWQCL